MYRVGGNLLIEVAFGQQVDLVLPLVSFRLRRQSCLILEVVDDAGDLHGHWAPDARSTA
jgi:hypothetical protein